MTDPLIEPAEVEVEVADFDAFFAEQAEPEPKGVPLRLYGRTYTLPPTLPALFTLQLHRVQHSARPDDIRRLLGSLFGPDAVDHWTEAGMSDRHLGIVLLWSTANVAEPDGVSMERAAQLYDEREAAKGKATPRRAPAKPRPKSKGKGKPRSSGKRS
ncbi:hypothetical protein OG883_31205 [Streptomyces sp. NBC_01142]|uniref:hypothetical protein n=1 Tax=Streptomyces sp. NBC_01142 TaxID=2975865 RepID=UPI00225AC856|nr:hypothetical protein [Streptomyces sp. NBC_01142]MCX4824248.1 hypothetical protein [Streptomyces sp. NBC_01142]